MTRHHTVNPSPKRDFRRYILASGSIALMGLKGTILVIIPSMLFGVATSVVFKDAEHASDSEVSDTGIGISANPKIWEALCSAGQNQSNESGFAQVSRNPSRDGWLTWWCETVVCTTIASLHVD